MEYRVWKAVAALAAELESRRGMGRFDFGDAEIVAVFYWGVVHDRPVSWACRPESRPPWLRRRRLPSPATMSRRLRSSRVVALLEAVERRVTAPKGPRLFWMIDGKPLPIGGCSKDRQAGYGRAAGCKAKGYKLHALAAGDGSTAAWRLAPMNKDERVMAGRLIRSAPPQVVGYLAADANYDSNKLHEACDRRGDLQLVTPRRYGPGNGTGHRKQTAGRRRSIALTEGPSRAFADQLLSDRSEIERQFGGLTNWGGGLSCLPPWVRGHRRVRLWVQAKLVLTGLRRQERIQTYVA